MPGKTVRVRFNGGSTVFWVRLLEIDLTLLLEIFLGVYWPRVAANAACQVGPWSGQRVRQRTQLTF